MNRRRRERVPITKIPAWVHSRLVHILVGASLLGLWGCRGASAQKAAKERFTNHLAGSTSPYLLMHLHNPVDWYPWSPEALAKAKSENKPIFLSVGYAACHWCHVMERDDFENAEIARILNTDFVSIKVDREERPDIDSQYIVATELMTGQGGWPNSVWLTPDLKPFYGGSYFPAAEFKDVLLKIASLWKTQRTRVSSQADLVSRKMQQVADAAAGKAAAAIPAGTSEKATTGLLRAFDQEHGGFGGAPKFPNVPLLLYLLQQYKSSQSPSILAPVTKTLDEMADGGIHDQLGGGFHRYTVDASWTVPHFEKMLYDQAEMAHVYLLAYAATGNERYKAVALDTLDFALREMSAGAQGGFIASLDADSEGEEGKFYLWTPAQVQAALGAHGADLIEQSYDVSAAGNVGGRGESVLRLGGPIAPGTEAVLAPIRAKLFAARSQRPRPAADDKVLAGWNGLMISALAAGYSVLGDARYLTAAESAANFIHDGLTRPDGSLLREARAGKPGPAPAFLDDYAYYSAGLLDLYAATHNPVWLARGRSVVTAMLRHFWDTDGGGGFVSFGPDGAPVKRNRDGEDDVTPSPSGIAAGVLERLARLPAEGGQPPAAASQLKRQAAATVQEFEPQIAASPTAYVTLISVWQSLQAK